MSSRARTIALIVVLVAGAVTCQSGETDLDTKLNAEIARLEAALAALDVKALPPDLADAPKGYTEAFARLKSTKTPALRLFRLRDTFTGVELLTFFAAHKSAGDDLESLYALVNERRPVFEKKLAPVKGPLLHRALAEAAGNRAQKLYYAAGPYGKIAKPWSGLYYLSEAEAYLRFREFLDSLPKDGATATDPKVDRNRMEAAAKALELETIAVLAQDPVTRAVISPSVKIKEARELLEQNLLDGAAIALLEARIALSRRKAEADPGSVTEGPKAAAVESRPDEETISGWLQGLSREGAPPVNVLVPRDVIPFYASLQQPLAVKSAAAAPAAVTVTLVRWPYT